MLSKFNNIEIVSIHISEIKSEDLAKLSHRTTLFFNYVQVCICVYILCTWVQAPTKAKGEHWIPRNWS